MEKKHENPRGDFWSMLPIMHGIDTYSLRSKYQNTLYVHNFMVPLIFVVWLPEKLFPIGLVKKPYYSINKQVPLVKVSLVVLYMV